MSNSDAAPIAAPTVLQIHLSIFIVNSLIHCIPHTGARLSMIAVPDFHILYGFVGFARGLFLSHVLAETLRANLAPQNLRTTSKLFFIKDGGELWCYVFQYILFARTASHTRVEIQVGDLQSPT